MDTMNAFFSSVDNSDDLNNVCYSGVVGKLNEPVPMTVWRFNYQGRKFEANFGDIFDEKAVPQEWLDKVTIPTKPALTSVSTARGRADHLKNYQFKKKDDFKNNSINGNRIGPQLRARNGFTFSEDDYGRYGLDAGVDSDYWNLSQEGNKKDSVQTGKQTSPQLGWQRKVDKVDRVDNRDKVFSQVMEDPSYPGNASMGDILGGTLLGKTQGEAGNQSTNIGDIYDTDSASPEDHPRYSELACNNGLDVATAFCTIDSYMPLLDGEGPLITDLVEDMFQLASPEDQTKLFRDLYNLLPRTEQEKLATSGF